MDAQVGEDASKRLPLRMVCRKGGDAHVKQDWQTFRWESRNHVNEGGKNGFYFE